MYMDSINSDNNFYALSSFGNVLICSDSISNPKTVTFPNGYNLDTNLAFKVVFVNGHNCVDDSTPMTLNGVPVVVNKFGTLIPLPIHEMDESGTTVYKSVMPNCVLEMYYTSNYDGNNNPAFVVIGNPIVLSSADYTIYADGKIVQSDEVMEDKFTYKILVEFQNGGSFTLPYDSVWCRISVHASDSVNIIVGSLDFKVFSGLKGLNIPCNDLQRSMWDVTNDGKTFTLRSGSNYTIVSVYYRTNF